MNVIAVDAMGGDHAPGPEVQGALAAVRDAACKVILVGDEPTLRTALAEAGGSDERRLSIRHAAEVVTMDDSPAQAYRQKRDSSMRVAFELVKSGEAGAFVSAGNSGAVLGHALFQLGRLPGVDRPGIVLVFPTPTGTLTLCDMGANVEVRPAMLAQFGILGAHFDRAMHGHHRPRVGLLSNGTEDSKGTELTRAAHDLLTQASSDSHAQFEYVGYVEGSEILRGGIDVVATDGFTGNIVLKLSEGVSEAVLKMVKAQLGHGVRSKLGAALVKPALLELKEKLHYSRFGGALLLGVNGVVTICHGVSTPEAIKNAIKATDRFITTSLTADLGAAIERHHRVWQQNGDVKNGAESAAATDTGK